eukprot:TRINITY_DN13631_c0_g1_i1.p1 TRINITY_DN13631_c0_g1~~TRINITY_DN13631_c0_g1_i1.p1  ORF type:complete len:150 (-),score=1.87 TRINITY_DN13631_c0_g1_i1:5-454(-)
MRETLYTMIKMHEGWRDSGYRCPAGHITIGWGHNIDANGLPDDIEAFLKKEGYILPIHGQRLLEEDIQITYKACQRLYPRFDSFSPERQDALIDFVFNLGEGSVKKFVNTNRAINAEDWERAAQGMEKSLWYRQVGNRSKRIVGMIRDA